MLAFVGALAKFASFVSDVVTFFFLPPPAFYELRTCALKGNIVPWFYGLLSR